MKLTPNTREALLLHTVEAFTAYSAVASPFATRTAEEDARRRLAVALAEQIAQRLALSANGWAV